MTAAESEGYLVDAVFASERSGTRPERCCAPQDVETHQDGGVDLGSTTHAVPSVVDWELTGVMPERGAALALSYASTLSA
jgi:hypothetical protein